MQAKAHIHTTHELSVKIYNDDSEALAVDDCGARLVVLTLGDPHLLEGAQRGKDRATNPDGILPLRWRDDLNLHGRRSQSCKLLGHALTDAREHGGAAREHDVGVEVLADIHIAFHDGLEGSV